MTQLFKRDFSGVRIGISLFPSVFKALAIGMLWSPLGVSIGLDCMRQAWECVSPLILVRDYKRE